MGRNSLCSDTPPTWVFKKAFIKDRGFIYAIPAEQILETARLQPEDLITVRDVPGLVFAMRSLAYVTWTISSRTKMDTRTEIPEVRGCSALQVEQRKYGLCVQRLSQNKKL